MSLNEPGTLRIECVRVSLWDCPLEITLVGSIQTWSLVRKEFITKVAGEMLFNIEKSPGMIRELSCNRLGRPNRSSGSTRAD